MTSFQLIHESGWVLHETTIVLNTIHLTIISHYLLYELLVILFVYMRYPKLPTLTYFPDYESSQTPTDSWRSWRSWISPCLKCLLLIGSLLGLIGSANKSLALVIINLTICCPFALYKVYQCIRGNFHSIDVDNFLLFQVLAVSTVNFVGILTVVDNIIFATYL